VCQWLPDQQGGRSGGRPDRPADHRPPWPAVRRTSARLTGLRRRAGLLCRCTEGAPCLLAHLPCRTVPPRARGRPVPRACRHPTCGLRSSNSFSARSSALVLRGRFLHTDRAGCLDRGQLGGTYTRSSRSAANTAAPNVNGAASNVVSDTAAPRPPRRGRLAPLRGLDRLTRSQPTSAIACQQADRIPLSISLLR